MKRFLYLAQGSSSAVVAARVPLMSAEDILVEIGHDLGRSAEQMQPIVDRVVHENWFTTVDQLRSIPDEMFKDMKIPGAVLIKLREKLALVGAVLV